MANNDVYTDQSTSKRSISSRLNKDPEDEIHELNAHLHILEHLYAEGDEDLGQLKEAIMNLSSEEYPALQQLKAKCVEITEKRELERTDYAKRVAYHTKAFKKHAGKVVPVTRTEKMAYVKEQVVQWKEESIGRSLTEEEKEEMFTTPEIRGKISFLLNVISPEDVAD